MGPDARRFSWFRRPPRTWLPLLLSLVIGFALVGCSAAAAGLNSFASPDGRYAFLYPTG